MEFSSLFKVVLFISILVLGNARPEDECIEVGFARASFGTVQQAFTTAKEEVLQLWQREDAEQKPTYKHFNPQVKNVTRAAHLLERTSKNILAAIRKTRVGKRCQERYLLKGIEKHVTPLMNLDKELAEEIGLVMSFRCMVGSPYPNVDGTCNHEQSPDQGSIGSKFLRLIPALSGEGGFGLRSSENKEKSLPSAREVARVIRKHLKRPDVTSMFTEISHFVALDSIDIPEGAGVEDVDCCKNPDTEECAPIFIEKDDPVFSKVKCLNYRRSAPAQAILGHRDFLTMVSTYLDANPVYGSTNPEAFQLKEGYFGYLKYPHSIDEAEGRKKTDCKFPTSFKGCFGLDAKTDKGFHENLRLLLTLEHNFIAEKLAEINPHFDDALLYNEARRIAIAVYDAIVYKEFLPLLIGSELATKHRLLPGSDGPGAEYIPDVNPGILNSHALATYRNPSMVDEWDSSKGTTEILTPRHYNGVRDARYVDMLAMDIQRARDHGVAVYSAWRGFCNNGKGVSSWEDVEEIFSKEVAEDLKKLYQDEVNDMDFLVGLLESPEDDAVQGKTFSCIAVDQFARLKTGNRYFWEFDSSILTREQRDVIKDTSSAAALLCRHFRLSKVPQNALKPVSESNPEVDCKALPEFDFSHWKDMSPKMPKQAEEEEEPVEEEPEEIDAEPEEEMEEEVVELPEEREGDFGGGTEPLPSFSTKKDARKKKKDVEKQKADDEKPKDDVEKQKKDDEIPKEDEKPKDKVEL